MDSLINQTYQNIEIIISDNASNDNTREIVEAKQKFDRRIRYYRNKQNLGYVKNINNAVEKANSEIIAIFHSDDVYESTIIEKELKQLLDNPGIGAVFVLSAIFHDNNISKKYFPRIYKYIKSTKIYNEELNIFIGNLKDYLPVITKYGNIFTCPSLFCYKNIYLAVGGFTDQYPSNEDFDLWLRIMNSGYKIAMIDEYLLNYRVSVSQGSNLYRSLPVLPMVYKVLIDFRKEHCNYFLDSKLDRNLRCFISTGYCRAAVNSIKVYDYNKTLLHIRMSKKYYNFSILSKVGLCQNVLYISVYLLKFIIKCFRG